MVIIHARVHVTPHHLQDAWQLAQQHVARSRLEPGCLSHAVYADPDHEHHLVFVEEWASQAALQQHFAVPASAAFVDALAAMASERPHIRLYEATELPFPGQRAS